MYHTTIPVLSSHVMSQTTIPVMANPSRSGIPNLFGIPHWSYKVEKQNQANKNEGAIKWYKKAKRILCTIHSMGSNQTCQRSMLWYGMERWLTNKLEIGEKMLRIRDLHDEAMATTIMCCAKIAVNQAGLLSSKDVIKWLPKL